MPKDAQINLQSCLSSLEELQNGFDDAEYSTTNRTHLNLLKSLNTVLESCKVSSSEADRVLNICLRCISDVRCVPYLFSIISTLINMDKDKPLVDFLPFALAILEFLNTKCVEDNTSNLQILSYQVLMSHPRNTLITLVRDHSPKIIETFGLSLAHKNLDLKMESFTLLRMLEWLPAAEKTLFVKNGTSLWMVHVVPAMILFLMNGEDENKIGACLTYIEILSNELVLQEYFDNPDWRILLECIADKKKFPSCIQSLMEKDKGNWHRIWIVLVKLLKSHVTRIFSPFGSPINAMLPIVEAAFKKEPQQRIRAFTCWNELIDSFYNETGNCVAKRIKLIIIPLKLNNAKTEDTAQAKFETWWLFMQKFRSKIQEYTNEILILFLHFLFGKNQAGKQTFQAYMISDNLRVKCLEAFSEVMGHIDCNQCPLKNLTRLDGEVTTSNLVVRHWKEYAGAMKSAVAAAAMTYTGDTKQMISCIWKSLLLNLTDLADNTVRQDMFDDVINIFSNLVSDPSVSGNDNILEIIVDDLTLPLMMDNKLKTLILSKSHSCRPLHKILNLLVDNKFNSFFKRYNTKEFMNHLIGMLFEEIVSTPLNSVCMFDDLPVTDISLRIWTDLVQLSTESNLCVKAFSSMLKWPFKIIHINLEIKEAALAWYTLYNIVHVKLEIVDFNNEISKVLTRPVEDSKATNYFVLFALIGVLKHKPDEEKLAKLEALSYEMNDYKDYEQLMPSLIETLVFMLYDSTINGDENLSQITINCVENILKVLKTETDVITPETPSVTVATANDPLVTITKLIECLKTSLKAYLNKCQNAPIKKQVHSILALHDNNETDHKSSPMKKDVPPKEFVSPKIQEIKKNKKKEASIFKTVVENGEEYVVVKSNWKFNPKNLTENQKEKLQRKRDIPALYQDLSQSQDEFKLTAWKTDSQDTSLSSSKSASNDVSDTLKQIPNTDIVPRIMENILDSDKKTNFNTNVTKAPVTNVKTQLDNVTTPVVPTTENVLDTDKNIDINTNLSPNTKVKTPKSVKVTTPGTKSPRMALKDRVFRNVRNLIEKSSPTLQMKATEKKEDTNAVENAMKSPVSKLQAVTAVTPCMKDKDSNPSINSEILSEKNDNQSPVTSLDVKMKKVVLVTAKKNEQNITLACTPVSKQQQEINISLSALQTAAERPSRVKRKPRKFDDSLMLGIKRKKSKNDSLSDSQDMEWHNEVTNAEVHALNDDDTDMEPPPMVTPKETENAVISTETSENDNIIVLNDSNETEGLNILRQKDADKTDGITLVSPATPVGKLTEKSPEKPTIGEIPNSKSKASDGMDNTDQNATKSIAQDNIILNTPLSLRKLRKSKGHGQLNSTNDENSSINTPETTKELSQSKLSAKKRVLKNDTIKNNEKSEVVSTPMIKMNEKGKEQISSLKSKVHNVELGYTNDENSSVSSPVISKELSQPKLSAKKRVLQNDTIKTHEKSVVLLTPTDKNKNVDLVCTNDKNASVNTPVITEEQNGSAKERVLQNDIHKIYETSDGASTLMIRIENPDQVISVKKSGLLKDINEIKKQPIVILSPLTKSKDMDQNKASIMKKETENDKNEENLLVTPKNKAKENNVKSTMKKKKSRIEIELTIDMVEGHPYLKPQPEKRLTRKAQMEVENSGRRKSLAEKLNKSKLDVTPKTTKKPKEKKTSPTVTTVTVEDSQDKAHNNSSEILLDEPPCSEDVIESSQDSTMTTISARSSKKPQKLQPIVTIEKISIPFTLTQNPLENSALNDEPAIDALENTDIELPQNKTVETDKNATDLTENMDTEPLADNRNITDLTENMDTEPMTVNVSDDVLSETLPAPAASSEKDTTIGPETQELAEADTQPNDPKQFEELDVEMGIIHGEIMQPSSTSDLIVLEHNDITQSLPEGALILANMSSTGEVSSSFKDDKQRKQDFLNNTVEISPIKVQSPVRNNKTPSPETSSDFVVIKLSSPVQSNGEPFEKPRSPEFFSEDKLSPDKRNASPPRVEVVVTNSSPSTSLSLKKNRPQVNRTSGRAAHMLGLLSVNPEIKITKTHEPEETKKPTTSTPARRNLRILYSSVTENNDNTDEQSVEEQANFLKLKRSLPTVSSSPSGPILKRKLADIADETTTSPANKRKRVSFHDPPVSTTVAVHKYIEPISLMRSPQSFGKKRLDRPTRLGVKSPKRLDNAFLDSALSKTVESFTETPIPSDDTENISLDVTPAVEVVKTSELNDTDPICPDLVDCEDNIDVIATELSSPAMRDLLIKELEGKLETVGDLAKMTELEVNRLCIKAPKITVAKKVLTDYITNRSKIAVETIVEEAFSEPMTESLLERSAEVEIQTDNAEVFTTATQTSSEPAHLKQTQTEIVNTVESSVQTDESGSKTTEDIINACISERDDFMDKLVEKLNDDQVKMIAEKLSLNSIFELTVRKTDNSTSTLLNRVLKQYCKGVPKDTKSNAELTFLRDYLFDRYANKELILMCSQILQKLHDKPL